MEWFEIVELDAMRIGPEFLNRLAERFKIGRWYGWCVHNFGMSWLKADDGISTSRLRDVALAVARTAARCCADVLRVVSQVSGADIARPSLAQGKLSCESSCRTFGGIAVATDRPLPGHCAGMTRDISPDVLPDVSRPSRNRLAGLRATIGEQMASRKNLSWLRGKACTLSRR
jgi:hypothetical protein